MNLTARVYLFYCLAIAPFCWAQFALFGELYISKYNEFHIAFETTYFAGGTIITTNEIKSLGLFLLDQEANGVVLKKILITEGLLKFTTVVVLLFP